MNEKELEKLTRFYETLKQGVEADLPKRSEVAQAFGTVLRILKAVREASKNDIESALAKFSKGLESASEEARASARRIEDALNRAGDSKLSALTEQMDALKAAISAAEAKIPEPQDLSHIERAIEELDIPTLEEIGEKLPLFGAAIRDGLELLLGDDRLDAKAIKGLIELIDERVKKGGSKGTVIVGGGASSGGRTVRAYDLSSQLNGVTKTFTLPAYWRIVSIHSSSIPGVFRPTVDFTDNPSTFQITFTSEINAATTLASGQTLLVTYAEA